MTIKRYEVRPPTIEAVVWDGTNFEEVRNWLRREFFEVDETTGGALVIMRGATVVARVMPSVVLSLIDGNVRVWLVDDGIGDHPHDVFLKQYREVAE